MNHFSKILHSSRLVSRQTIDTLLPPASACLSTSPAPEPHNTPVYPKKNPWNRAVTEAEKLVGFPTSYLSMSALFNDEFSNIALHMRKLIGSDHPVLKTAKRLIFHGKNNMQVRGLLVLLLSRANGPNGQKDYDPSTGVLERQRKLAEIVEMIHTAQAIHQAVVNIPVNTGAVEDPEARADLAQLEYGNKISILSGDYLLANACTGLAHLRITKIVEIVAVAIGEFTQSEFVGLRDAQGMPIPTEDQLSMEAWEARNGLAVGSLLGAGCQGAMLLAGMEEDRQKVARELGHHLALAIQAHHEIQQFVGDGGPPAGLPFNLCTAPVLFHLQNDSELLQYIGSDQLNNLDYRKLMGAVVGGQGIEAAKQLCHRHVQETEERLGVFGGNDAAEALGKIVGSLKF